MAWARRILDVAYADFGIEPIHGITDIRIQEEEAKYEYATAIFAPNMNVEKALAGSPLEQHVLSSSYGVDTTKASPERSYRENHDLTFIFCGYACVRKGAHYMLEAWKDMPGNHKLQLVGKIEPVIAERYRDLLASDRVEVVGFVDDVHAYFSRADVFLMPSLEEGGPQVTYEAALHGLPIIASAMGASRLGDTPGSMIIIDPAQISDFREAMEELVASAERREALGRKARQLAFEFDWMDVGARRAGSLEEYFA
ncbi:glycosyltransferase family 4 protein [Profundibacter sp.]